jgi:hypothetical protein
MLQLGLARPDKLSPDSDKLLYIGRHLVDSTSARFDWVGSGFEFEMAESGEVSAELECETSSSTWSSGEKFTVWVNHERHSNFEVSSSEGKEPKVLGNFRSGDRVFVQKNGESALVTLRSVSPGRKLTTQKPRKDMRIDIYGDSDTAADAVTGWGGSQDFSYSWAMTVANELNADIHVQAVSGIGVTAALGGPPLPQVLERVLLSRPKPRFSESEYDWRPDVIATFVGNNDFFVGSPAKHEFESAYKEMIRQIRQQYSDGNSIPVLIIGFCPQFDWKVNPILQDIAATTTDAKYICTPKTGQSGGTGHRNDAEHKQVGEAFSPKFEEYKP